MSPQIDADGISHRDDVHSGAVRDARDLVIPGHYPHALSPLALHLQKCGYRHLGLHQVPRCSRIRDDRSPNIQTGTWMAAGPEFMNLAGGHGFRVPASAVDLE